MPFFSEIAPKRNKKSDQPYFLCVCVCVCVYVCVWCRNCIQSRLIEVTLLYIFPKPKEGSLENGSLKGEGGHTGVSDGEKTPSYNKFFRI